LIGLHTVNGRGISKGKNTRKPRTLNPAKPLKSKPLPESIPTVTGEIVSLARGQGKNAWGLTSKQESYCQGVGARGETLSDAYRAAYETENMAPATIHAEACRLMANPVVAARINDLVRQRTSREQHDAVRIRATVIERLHVEAHDPDNPPSVRVRALELLGKLDIVGAFRDRIEAVTAEPPASDLAATLEARLRALLPSPDKA
jgi:hypothetical protein